MTKRQLINEYIATSEDFMLNGDLSVNTVLRNLEYKFKVKFDKEELINDELERHATEIGTILYNWLETQEIE
tara:strand:+ start:1299 stop:1514 length:216 start_codon:yes stop_codon:yes gene_type:complete